MSNPHYRVSREGEVHLMELELPYQMDAAEFDKLNDAMEGASDAAIAGRWVLDMSQAQYIGSALLGLMVNMRQRIKAGGGRLVLCGLSPHLIKALATCSLHNFFITVPTRAEAIRRASGR